MLEWPQMGFGSPLGEFSVPPPRARNSESLGGQGESPGSDRSSGPAALRSRVSFCGNFLLRPNQMEESYPTTIYLLGGRKGSLLPKKSHFLLLKPGSVCQSYVLRKGNRLESFAEIYLSEVVRAGGSVAGADSQPPVPSWAGPTTGWVSRSPQKVDEGPERPSDCSFLCAASARPCSSPAACKCSLARKK